MWHGPPRVIRGWGLGEPNISRVTRKLATVECPYYGIAVANLAACGIHKIGAALHFGEQRIVKHVLRLGVKRSVDGHNVAHLDHLLDAGMKSQLQLLFDRLRE